MEISEAGLEAARRAGTGNNRRSVGSTAAPVRQIIEAYLQAAGEPVAPQLTVAAVSSTPSDTEGYTRELEMAQPGPGKKKEPTGRYRWVGPWVTD